MGQKRRDQSRQRRKSWAAKEATKKRRKNSLFLISIDCSRRCSELLTKKRERRAENSKLELWGRKNSEARWMKKILCWREVGNSVSREEKKRGNREIVIRLGWFWEQESYKTTNHHWTFFSLFATLRRSSSCSREFLVKFSFNIKPPHHITNRKKIKISECNSKKKSEFKQDKKKDITDKT